MAESGISNMTNEPTINHKGEATKTSGTNDATEVAAGHNRRAKREVSPRAINAQARPSARTAASLTPKMLQNRSMDQNSSGGLCP